MGYYDSVRAEFKITEMRGFISYIFTKIDNSVNIIVWQSFLGEGNGNSLQYSCLENPTDRGVWRDIAHGVTESHSQLSD